MHESHLVSKHMAFTSINEVTDGNFEVTSESSKLLKYNVNKLQDSCELTNCYIRCCECNVCGHIFTCTCPHFSIIACSRKHIHLVKRYLFSKNPHSEENEQPVNQYTNNEIMEAFDKIMKNKPGNFYDFNTCKGQVDNSIFCLVK